MGVGRHSTAVKQMSQAPYCNESHKFNLEPKSSTLIDNDTQQEQADKSNTDVVSATESHSREKQADSPLPTSDCHPICDKLPGTDRVPAGIMLSVNENPASDFTEEHQREAATTNQTASIESDIIQHQEPATSSMSDVFEDDADDETDAEEQTRRLRLEISELQERIGALGIYDFEDLDGVVDELHDRKETIRIGGQQSVDALDSAEMSPFDVASIPDFASLDTLNLPQMLMEGTGSLSFDHDSLLDTIRKFEKAERALMDILEKEAGSPDEDLTNFLLKEHSLSMNELCWALRTMPSFREELCLHLGASPNDIILTLVDALLDETQAPLFAPIMFELAELTFTLPAEGVVSPRDKIVINLVSLVTNHFTDYSLVSQPIEASIIVAWLNRLFENLSTHIDAQGALLRQLIQQFPGCPLPPDVAEVLPSEFGKWYRWLIERADLASPTQQQILHECLAAASQHLLPAQTATFVTTLVAATTGLNNVN
eukprot:m.236721 g.236721  ORF g.236721 m.236721 type:complete len:486 (-) comp17103_c3_seq1:3607-5064(-)